MHQNAAVHLQAARGYAQLTLWSEAAAEFAASFRLAEPPDVDDWLRYAVLLRKLGDDAAYDKLVARLLARFARREDAAQSGLCAVMAAALAPSAGGEPARLVGLAESAQANQFQRVENRLALALARFRAGQYEAAIADLETARRDFDSSVWFARQPLAWLVLALAHAGAGRRDEAVRWLDRADSYVDYVTEQLQNGPQFSAWLPLPWQEWAAFLILRREAWIACRGGAPPDDPRARLVSGLLRAALGLRPAALADLEFVVARMPDDPRGWIELGRLHAEAGSAELADAAFARAALLHSTDPQAFIDRAWWLAGPLPAGFALDPAVASDPALPLGAATPGGAPVVWSSARTGCGGWIDFKRSIELVDSASVAALGLLPTPVDCDLALEVDATKPVRVWLNGRLVHDGKGRPSPSGLDHDLVPVHLRRGRNALLAQTTVNSLDPCIFVRFADSAASPEARFGRSSFLVDAGEPAFRSWLDSMRQARYRPAFVHADVVDGEPRFAALAFHDPEGQPWEYRIDPDRNSWSRTFEALRTICQPVCLTCYPRVGATVFVSLWRRTSGSRAWYVRSAENREAIERHMQEEADGGWGLKELLGLPEGGTIQFAAIGGLKSTDWWYLAPWDHDAAGTLVRDATWQMSRGLCPLSLTSYPDGGRSRFAMVLTRNNAATQPILLMDLSARSFACFDAHFRPAGFRPRYLTPYRTPEAWRGYMAGWDRSELPEAGEAVPALTAIETVLADWLRERGMQGGTLAVAKEGRVLLARSFGWADRYATRPIAPGDPMRLASLSKIFTAAAINKLIAAGKLRSDDSVIDVLDLKPPKGRTMDARWKRITIEHLITHRGGWEMDVAAEPMNRTHEIAAALGRPAPATAADIVQYMAGEPLQFEPGSKEVYSNFGYCVLGRVIEKVSGQSYFDYVRTAVLTPLGIRDIALGRSLPKDRNPREPEYIHPFRSRDIFSSDSTATVSVPDGGLCLEAEDSLGGLIGTAADVARFFSHHGGANGRLDPPAGERRYYFGRIPGTFAMALRLPGNVVIVVLCNQSVAVSDACMMTLAQLMERTVSQIHSWPSVLRGP
jgi:CubicO group peptidase (beta-lactamase class C family)/tetratricopeptide (TPR) repeat protein